MRYEPRLQPLSRSCRRAAPHTWSGAGANAAPKRGNVARTLTPISVPATFAGTRDEGNVACSGELLTGATRRTRHRIRRSAFFGCLLSGCVGIIDRVLRVFSVIPGSCSPRRATSCRRSRSRAPSRSGSRREISARSPLRLMHSVAAALDVRRPSSLQQCSSSPISARRGRRDSVSFATPKRRRTATRRRRCLRWPRVHRHDAFLASGGSDREHALHLARLLRAENHELAALEAQVDRRAAAHLAVSGLAGNRPS